MVPAGGRALARPTEWGANHMLVNGRDHGVNIASTGRSGGRIDKEPINSSAALKPPKS